MQSQRSKGLDSRWFKGILPEKKAEYEAILRASTTLIDRLKEMLTDRIKEVHQAQLSMDDYSTPSWAFKQAHRNGREQELRAILTLISFDPKE